MALLVTEYSETDETMREQVMRDLVPGLAWFDVSDPMAPELDELAKRFGLHELEIEDCRHRPQRAKVEDYLCGAQIFIERWRDDCV